MKIDITPIEDVDDGILITTEGMWNHAELVAVVQEIQRLSPTYVILDPTNSIIAVTQALSFEETSELRRKNIKAVVQMMAKNPRMLYIVINRNENPAFLSSMSVYEEYGVTDRYFFVKTLDEAKQIIRDHKSPKH